MYTRARRSFLRTFLTALAPAPVRGSCHTRRRSIPNLEVLEVRDVPSSVTLTPVADNTLYQDPTGSLSNGAGTEMYAGTTNQLSNNIRRAVMRFDLSQIPAGATIDSVALTLNMSKARSITAETMSLHQLTSSWGEGTSNAATGGAGSGQGDGIQATTNDATWVYRFFNTQQWTTAGGDFSATVSASTSVGGVGSYSWSGAGMVSDVQQWVNNVATNFGWILIGDEGASATVKQFDTRENLPANQPTLVVQFTTPADLTIGKTHTGNFIQGDAADTYSVQVSNSGGAATSGPVTVTDTLPTGLTPTAANSGTIAGWAVSFSGQTITATRSDALAAGSSYPDLTLTVGVAADAPASVTNTATVSLSGEQNTSNNSASDPTTILPGGDLTVAASHTGTFTEGDAADTVTISVNNVGPGFTSGTVTLTDTLPAGLAPTAADTGTIAGWTVSFSGQTITAHRSDALANGASYPDLTLTVAVSENAPASVTNSVTVSGGGEQNTSNDNASDTIPISLVPDLTIAKSHSGNFVQGDAADTYTVTVTNRGGAATTAAATVTDTLPAGLAPTAADTGTIAGWTVFFSGQTITATRGDALAAGASYPDLPITVAVAANAPASVVNSVTVAGGGEVDTGDDSASDPTSIVQVADLTVTAGHTPPFTHGDAADSLAITAGNAGPGPTRGTVTVTDTLPAGLTPTAADTGIIAGWTVSFSGQTITAHRSDALASGVSYPDLTLTVAVANDAPASVTNTVTVSGGGEIDLANDAASDAITIDNAAPTVTVPVSATTADGTALVLAGISVGDVDNSGAGEFVVLGVTSGTLTVNTAVSGGLDASAVLGNNSSLVSLSGTLAQLNATLADAHGLVFTPAAGFVGTATLTVLTNDLGNTGSGGPRSAMAAEAISVVSNGVDHYTVDVPASVIAGAPFTVTVTARDRFGATVTDFAGTARLIGTDPHGQPPATLTLAGGVGSFGAALPTAGNQSFVAIDGNNPAFTGTATVQVIPAAAARLVFAQQPTTTLAATPFLPPVSVTALDAFGNVATTDNSDVVTIGLRNRPAGSVLSGTTSVRLVGGLAVFPTLQLNKVGAGLTLIATAPTLPSVQSHPFDVAGVVRFTLTTTKTTLTAGTDLTVTVAAVDALGHAVSNYGGTVHFSSSDKQAVLPGDTTLTQGQGTFTVTPRTMESFTLTVSDLARPAFAGRLARPVTVTPAAVQALTISGLSGPVVAGTALNVTVAAVDRFGNVNAGYQGSVPLTSTDPAARLPGAHPFVAGKVTFPVTLTTPGLRAITASDGVFTVTQSNIAVAGTSVTVLTQPDPANAAQSALVIIGTAGNDAITIAPASADGTQVTVLVKGVAQGTFAPTGHILIYGVAGTDAIAVQTGTGSLAGVPVAIPAVITAGTGTVTVDASGSSSNNILVGGPGHDTLTAGTGNDILIGGAGTSVLHAGTGSDLLVGGATAFDANVLAILQLMNEWGNTSTSYLTRVQHLTGTLAGGANAPTAFLNGTTAHSAKAVSQLTGGSGLDWFLGHNPDVVANLLDGDVFTQI